MKRQDRRRSQQARPGANSPRGGNRSALSCPINRRGLGAEGAPRVAPAKGRGKEGRAAAVARSHGPFHQWMSRHINGKLAECDEPLQSPGSDCSTSSVRPLTHTLQLSVCVCVTEEE